MPYHAPFNSPDGQRGTVPVGEGSISQPDCKTIRLYALVPAIVRCLKFHNLPGGNAETHKRFIPEIQVFGYLDTREDRKNSRDAH